MEALDYISSVCLLVSIWSVEKNKNWWLLYSFGCLLFSIVTVNRGLIGLPIMGFLLVLTGIKNYLQKR